MNKKDLIYTYTFKIFGLNAGDYNITMHNNQTNNYNASLTNASFTVYKANSSVVISNVVNGTFNTTSVNVTYTIDNKTNVSYFIKNNVTGANFTVVVKDGKFIVINATKGLDTDNYRFNLTKINDEYVFTIIGVEAGNYTISILNNETRNFNASSDTYKFVISSALFQFLFEQ